MCMYGICVCLRIHVCVSFITETKERDSAKYYVYACMYVFVHVCICICIYTCVHVYTIHTIPYHTIPYQPYHTIVYV